MKKYVKQIIAATVISSLIVTGVHFAFFRDAQRNSKDPYVTDGEGHTYATTEYEGSKNYIIVEGEDGRHYLAILDENGNVGEPVTDENGNVVYADVQDVVLPTNTTEPPVSISASNSNSYTGDVQTTAPTNPQPSTEESTTQPTTQPNTPESTTQGGETPSATNPVTPTNPSNPQYGTYLADQYRALFESGTYMIEFTTNDAELGDTPIKAAFKNGRILMSTSFMDMSCTILYDPDGSGYLMLDDYKKYCKLPDELMESLDGTSGKIEEDAYIAADVSTVQIDGVNLICESFTASSGEVTKYFFEDGVLVRRDTITPDGVETCMYFNVILSDVPDSTFDIPKNYGYINLSWAGFLFE